MLRVSCKVSVEKPQIQAIALNCDLCLYANDSMLPVSGKNVTQIEKAFEKEMNVIIVVKVVAVCDFI